jgi:hypothetical protein
MGMRGAASNGPDPNASGITALHAANRFLEVRSAAGHVKNPLPMNWTGLYKNPLDPGFERQKGSEIANVKEIWILKTAF